MLFVKKQHFPDVETMAYIMGLWGGGAITPLQNFFFGKIRARLAN